MFTRDPRFLLFLADSHGLPITEERQIEGSPEAPDWDWRFADIHIAGPVFNQPKGDAKLLENETESDKRWVHRSLNAKARYSSRLYKDTPTQN